jgi:hypothetical protein
MATNYILSYPHSGNHLVRFFIELLSELPTSGIVGNPEDTPLFKNVYPESIPFNISDTNQTNYIYTKEHWKCDNCKNMIFIVRNPRESLARYDVCSKRCDWYFDLIDKYMAFSGKKLLLYYEDILCDKQNFITKLYDFLNIENMDKLSYCLDNCEHLYNLSINGTKRAWAGNNSKGIIDKYWNECSDDKKKLINVLLSEKHSEPKYNVVLSYYEW